MRSMTLVIWFLLGAMPALAEVHVVQQINFTYDPADITVAPGDTVEWHWTGGNHPMSSGDNCTADGIYFEDLPLDSNDPIASFVVPEDGTTFIPYFCIPHCGIQMIGTITVESGKAVPAASTWGLLALTLTLALGGAMVLRRRRPGVAHGS